MIIVTWWLMSHLIILAYDPAAISIPSFGVNDIWSLLFKFAWVVWLWRHHDVIASHKISLVYHVISLVPVSSHILNQTSFYKTMIGTFSVPYQVTHKCHMIETVTWFCHVTPWGHMIFRFILFWNVQIGRNSLVFQPIHVGSYKYECNFS